MATYVNDLRLKEIGTGESSGTWGTETNVNLELIGEALGYGTEAITTNADTHTTTVADGSTDPGRAMYIKYTGTLDSACTITIGPNTINRLHYIENATSGSQNIIISQGSGANITIPAGDTKAVYLDGAGSGAAVVDVFASFSTVDLKVQDDLTVTDDATIGGTLGVTGILTCTDDIIIGDGKTIGSASDVDAMTIASNGQVTFTQTLIGTALDISGDIDIDGTSNLDVVDIDGAVDMASTLTLAGNADFNGDLDVDGTANLDVVDIDGAVDMASTLTLAGNADFNGDLDVDGTTNLDVVDIDGAVDMASTLQVDGAITSSAGATITLADNTDNLTLTTTDADANQGPNLRLYRNSSSPADSDLLGYMNFDGRNDNTQDVTYVQIASQANDVSDGTEDGSYYINTMLGGTLRNRANFTPTELVLNEEQRDLDFRVESDGNANMLFVDASENQVSIGSALNRKVFNVVGTFENTGVYRDYSGGGVAANYFYIGRKDTNGALVDGLRISGGGDDAVAASHTGYFEVAINKSGTFTPLISSYTAADVVINDNSADIDFRVESNNNTHMVFVDGGSDHVNIGTSTDHGGTLNVQTTDNSVNLVLVCTDTDGNEGPILDLTRDAGNVPSDGDISGRIRFRNDNTNLDMTNYIELTGVVSDVSDGTEDGQLQFNIIDAGTLRNFAHMTGGSGTVFNEDSNNIDFRVESDAESNAFRVQASTGQVAVGSRRGFKFGFNELHGVAGSSGGGYPTIGYNVLFTGTSADFGTLTTDTSWRIDIGNNNRLQVHSRSSSSPVSDGATFTAGPYVALNGTTWTDGSDARLKENVSTITGADAVAKVKAMRPVNYSWIHDEDASNQIGFIAQEMVGVVPEVVDLPDDEEDHYGIQYAKLVPMLTAALQEALTKIETLESRIEALEL